MKTFPSHIALLGITCMILLAGCEREKTQHIPYFKVSADKAEGLTTDIFTFKINPQSTTPPDEKLHGRWDWEGDSVFNSLFTDDLEVPHRFYKPGNHRVICEVLSLSGGKAFDTISIIVKQGYSAPKASFKVVPETGHFKTVFLFDASGTRDDEDSLETLQFRWNFQDDGLWDTPYSNEPTVIHKFDKVEDYKVSLEVLDPSKRSGSITQILEVHRTDTCIVPNFIWSSENGRVSDIFTFDASSSYHQNDPGKTFTFKWLFPNQEYTQSIDDPLIDHQFKSPGIKIVVLLVEDDEGLQNTLEKELFVSIENTPPSPKIITPTRYGNIETQFYLNAWESLDDMTPTSKLLLRWDFDGDGNWDTNQNSVLEIHHQYTSPGKYTCIMEAEDEEGLKDLTSFVFWVSPYDYPTGYFQDKRDRKYYGTVKIGDQWWMSDNLDYRDEEKMNIPMFQKCYDDDDTMCDQYGSLYQAGRVISYLEEGNKLCPEGWRLPTKDDLAELASNIPESDPRNSLMVGGSIGFNARYTGFGSYVIGKFFGRWDTVYTYEKFREEVRYMSRLKRNSFDLRSQYIFGIQRDYEGFNLMWGDIDGYYPVRCIKED